ncbi:MAG: TIGR01459 family HAD-type hydrolase [Hyphomicrobiales bacterium]|nr:MAG: TIGR01459 family HAD-type hydrolase [Hyphomicrobiales bacterium]
MTPPIIHNAGPLLSRYEVLLCDVWGVVHNGQAAYAAAGEALARYRAEGGTVILVSNVPLPAQSVERVLEKTGVRRDAWDAIVAGGDIALAHIAAKGYRRLHWVGDQERDRGLFKLAPGPSVPIAEAEAILCTGLVDDVNETVEHYRPMLEAALARKLPFVCANPDFVVDVGEKRHLCAGSLAAEYERMGGEVYWGGKPHLPAYQTGREKAAQLRGAMPDISKILGIGDTVRTDLGAAQALGCDALLITAGIHRDIIMRGEDIDEAALAALFAEPGTPPAVAAMNYLRW